MSIPTVINRPQRRFVVKPDDDGKIADMGPPSTGTIGGAYIIQFIPSEDFTGQFAVLGRVYGKPSVEDGGAQFATIPYRAINTNGTAATSRDVVTAVITGPGIIEVPASGLSVGLLIACSAGSCTVVSQDLNEGSSL